MTNPRLPGSPYAYERRRKSAEKGKNPVHYADMVPFRLTEDIDKILYFIAIETYRQPLINLDKKTPVDVYKRIPDDADANLVRATDGVQHAARVAIAAEAFFQLYQHYGNDDCHDEYEKITNLLSDDEEHKSILFVKLLTITAFCHDVARSAKGDDREEWEENSAIDCQRLIKELITNYKGRDAAILSLKQNAPAIAKIFSDGIRNKCSHPVGIKPKGLIARILHDADYLDSMRKPADSILPGQERPFCVNELEFWQDSIGAYQSAKRSYISKDLRVKAQNRMMQLIFEWRNVINDFSDLKTPTPIEILLPAKNNEVERITVSKGIKNHFNLVEKDKFEVHQRPLTFVRHKLNTEKYLCIYTILNQSIDDDDEAMEKMSAKPKYMPFRFAYYHLASYLDNAADSRLLAAGFPDDEKIVEKIIAVERIVADAMKELCKVVGDESIDQPTKIAAVKEFHRVTDPLLEGKHAKLKAAITFFAVTALAVILGATIGLIIGIATGAIAAGPIGGIAGGIIGMFAGGIKAGIAAGCFTAGAITIGALSAKAVHYKTRHTFFNTHVKMLADYAERIACHP